MKLIKIGKAPSNDIVLGSEYVSAHHANITILDNGDIILEDIGSTNGTYVGAQKINAKQDVVIRRGDAVRFADVDLPWAKVPQPDDNSKYKQVINIGSNSRNDIVLGNATVSRYHATFKIGKDGKNYIVDNGSSNGTTVNGVRIKPDQPVPVKKGDQIALAGESITAKLLPYMKGGSSNNILPAIIGVIIIAVIAGAAYLFMNRTAGPDTYKNTVAYVRANYSYLITIQQDPLDRSKDIQIPLNGGVVTSSAFFIDNEGRLATNRRVAMPWAEEYRDAKTNSDLAMFVKTELAAQLNLQSVDLLNTLEVNKLLADSIASSKLGKALQQQQIGINALLLAIRNLESSKVVVNGQINELVVGYNGINYTKPEEFQAGVIVAASEDPKEDYAIIQINTKKTPSNVTTFDVHSAYEGEYSEDTYGMISYPFGQVWGGSVTSMETKYNEAKFESMPNKYTFEVNVDEESAALGSPIFNSKGELMGIVSEHQAGAKKATATCAKYLKTLYSDSFEFNK